MERKTLTLLFALSMGFFSSTMAQQKELDHSAYDSWKRITQAQLTPEGKFLSYQVMPQEGDGMLVIRRLADGREIKVPRGYDAKLSPDGRWAYCLVKPLFQETRKAKIAKKQAADMPKDSLAYINMVSGQVSKLSDVLSFETGRTSMPFVACMAPMTHAKKAKGKANNMLIVLNPQNGQKDTIRLAEYYAFNKAGDKLSVTIKADKKDSLSRSSVLLISLPSMKREVLSTDKAYYSLPAFDEKGQQLAFLASTDSTTTGNKHCSLFLYNKGIAKEVIPQDYRRNLPDGWSLNENSNPCFSTDGKRLFVGTAPYIMPKDTTKVDFETARVDVWNYADYLTQPQQKFMLKRLKEKTYLSVINLDNPTVITPLTTSMFDRITLMNGGDAPFALSSDETKYMIAATWDSNECTDLALVSLKDGSRKTVAAKVNGPVKVSPNGKYLLWYNLDDTQWYCYNVQKGTTVCLTKRCGVNFYDEEYDEPSAPDAYDQSPVWTAGDEAVLICDRYDIWKFQPDGKSYVNLSKGDGRKNRLQYRYINMVDPDFSKNEVTVLDKQISIKKGERVYLTAFDEVTKKNGMATLSSMSAQVPEAFVDTFSYNAPCKAQNAPVIAFQKGNFAKAYNMYVTIDNFKTDVCLSDINPQMKDYRWGTAHLVSWKAYDGTPLNGLLYIPDNIDKSKKYPVMIYFYERRSETLYNYMPPAPSRSTVNIPFYCSRGYLVFVPDIVYKTGHPGECAYNCIVSGAEAICQQFPYADRANMAIQGQSWGGYQTAYLVTRTNLFKAAGAGAPVSNMTSAYGGIRWEGGITRAWQYEHKQSRIGKSLWDKGGLDLYIENSPLFHADKVETPLLIMHNDADGAVPWYQGIEYYSALRRLGKKVWMLEYNDEAHNLVERRNMKDLSIRLQQFFDHYLKGAPMPAWMKTGVPATKKGDYFGFEPAE